MLTVAIFIIIIGLLIFVHELGHFLLAKRSGARVDEFGFGFPPRILGIQRAGLTKGWRTIWGAGKRIKEKLSDGGTIYSVNAIPLGGFVKILGEDGQEKNNQQSFAAKKIWQRALILSAGVTMNFLLAFFLLSLGFFIGLPTAVNDSEIISGAKVQITEISVQSPAESAGLKVGDAIIKIAGSPGMVNSIEKVSQIQDFTERSKGEEITITLERGRELVDVKITPRADPPAGQGAMGVGLARIVNISYPWYRSLYEGFLAVIDLVWLILSTLGVLLWQLIGHGRLSGDVAGPVGIYAITGQAAQMGFIYLLQLTALLSINLAIINILPFPALDGGRLLFLLIEKIKGSPVSQKIEQAIHTFGFVFLILLMVFITVRDVIKLF